MQLFFVFLKIFLDFKNRLGYSAFNIEGKQLNQLTRRVDMKNKTIICGLVGRVFCSEF